MDWQERGYCLGANPDIFSEPGYEEIAKAYCDRCPVRVQCLEHAMSENEQGVWGGTTDGERKSLKRPGSRRSCPGCAGTRLFSDGTYEICTACGLSWLG